MFGFGRAVKRFTRRFKPPVVVGLKAVAKPSQKFDTFAKDGNITVRRKPIFDKSDVFFTMGSCFAMEIRFALAERNLTCVPRYREIKFDPSVSAVDTLPDLEHMNFYNTFTVRLQLEQLLGHWEQAEDDYWVLKRGNAPWGTPIYQDPYRRMIIAKTPEILADTIATVNANMKAGFDEATAFVFTFGMTEVFVNQKSGKVASQKPLYKGGGGLEETKMHISTFEENLENVRAIVNLVRSKKPDAPIVMTVSPVALSRTFQDEDIVTINTESKSILRAVLGQVSREFENVLYLPSYEFVTAKGYDQSYESDRRHVKRPVVRQIVGQFFDAYFKS
jgi:hypothetical protein